VLEKRVMCTADGRDTGTWMIGKSGLRRSALQCLASEGSHVVFAFTQKQAIQTWRVTSIVCHRSHSTRSGSVDQLIRCTSRSRRVRLYRVTATAPPSPARRRRKPAIKAAPCHLITPQPHHRSSLATPLHSENIPFICDVLLQTDAGRKPRHKHHHRCPGSGPVDRSAMLRYYHHPATPAPAPPV
jgi:hypothetical protein